MGSMVYTIFWIEILIFIIEHFMPTICNQYNFQLFYCFYFYFPILILNNFYVKKLNIQESFKINKLSFA